MHQQLQPDLAELSFNSDNMPFSLQFNDIYFSTDDGLAESHYVFLQGNQLYARWQQHTQAHFVIAESGFGSGLNFFACIQLFRQFRAKHPTHSLQRLYFISFEKYPLTPQQLQQAHLAFPELAQLSSRLIQHYPFRLTGCHRLHFAETTLDLWFGDIHHNLPQLGDYMQQKIDAWFLDGFAPSKNPEMWTPTLYQHMFRYSQPHATFATFTAASAVRKGLQAAGFIVNKQTGFAHKRDMLCGYKPTQTPTADRDDRAPWYLAHSASRKIDEVAIIGGGIASLFTALSCLQRGLKVTLYCDDPQPALNASGNKQGALYPQLSDDDLRNSRFYAYAFSYALQVLHDFAQSGVQFESGLQGVAICAYSCKVKQTLDQIAAQQWDRHLFHLCDQHILSELTGIQLPCGGAFIPKGGWIAPQQLVQNGFDYLQTRGLTLRTKQHITHLHSHENSWQLTNSQGERFEHSLVILANGHQLTQFAQTEHLPLYPVRGQVSQIPSGTQLKKLKAVLCYNGYLTPADHTKQSHCIGASHVRNCASRTFSLEEQQQNAAKILHNLPHCDWSSEIDVSDNQARVSVRCGTRERVPIMGAVPHFAHTLEQYRKLFDQLRRRQPIAHSPYYPNLYLIGALGSRGLTSAPLLAETLVCQILGEPLPIGEDILHALNPNRTWIRKLLKGSPIRR